MENDYIQIGVTATRNPVTGEFYPSVPLYIRASDAAEDSRKKMMEDFAKLAALQIQRERELREG